jgi:hypothetical protein
MKGSKVNVQQGGKAGPEPPVELEPEPPVSSVAGSAPAVAEGQALEASLKEMKLTELKRRARSAGIDAKELENADDTDDIKAAVIELIVKKGGQNQRLFSSHPIQTIEEGEALKASLLEMKLTELKRRARSAGIDAEELENADDADDIKAAVIELIVKEGRQTRRSTGGPALPWQERLLKTLRANWHKWEHEWEQGQRCCTCCRCCFKADIDEEDIDDEEDIGDEEDPASGHPNFRQIVTKNFVGKKKKSPRRHLPEDVALLKKLVRNCQGDANTAREIILLNWRFLDGTPDDAERRGMHAIDTLSNAKEKQFLYSSKGDWDSAMSSWANFAVLIIGFVVPTVTGLNQSFPDWTQWPLISQLTVMALSIAATVLNQLERTWRWRERARIKENSANELRNLIQEFMGLTGNDYDVVIAHSGKGADGVYTAKDILDHYKTRNQSKEADNTWIFNAHGCGATTLLQKSYFSYIKLTKLAMNQVHVQNIRKAVRGLSEENRGEACGATQRHRANGRGQGSCRALYPCAEAALSMQVQADAGMRWRCR